MGKADKVEFLKSSAVLGLHFPLNVYLFKCTESKGFKNERVSWVIMPYANPNPKQPAQATSTGEAIQPNSVLRK